MTPTQQAIARFRQSAAQIERDVRLSELTDEEIAALLSAACEPGEEWIPISQKPHRPLAAILSFGNRKWTDQDGNPTELGHPRDHAENMDIACWDGEAWVEQYTGHDVLEDWKDASEMPTHWCPLPVPPAAIAAFGGGDCG
jgi:hypothetical protein